jgi:cell division ATPase FtsA
VTATRVMLAGLPAMLRGIVRNAADTVADVVVVADVQGVAGVRDTARANAASVVVVDGLRKDELETLAGELLALDPAMQLIAIDADGSAVTHVTRRGRSRVDAPSPDTLMGLMRG